MMRGKLYGALVFACAGSMVLASASSAQSAGALDRPLFGVGYAANAPEMLLGGGGYVVFPAFGGLGLYLDAKFDASSPSRDDTYEPGLTAEDVENELGDEYRDTEGSWRSINAAIIRPVTPTLMLYAGGGYATESVYRQYVDRTGSRGVGGIYRVRSPAEDESTVNLMAGMFLRLSRRLNAHFGAESAPRGFAVGMSFVFD